MHIVIALFPDVLLEEVSSNIDAYCADELTDVDEYRVRNFYKT